MLSHGSAGTDAQSTLTRTVAEIQAWLVARLAEELKLSTASIAVDEPFASYGVSSRAAVTLLGDLEAWLARELSPTTMWEYPTVHTMARYLAEAQPAPDKPSDPMQPPAPLTNEPIAIIGQACRFPGADSPEAFWKMLCSGHEPLIDVPPDRWNIDTFFDPNPETPGKMYIRQAHFVSSIAEFDAHFFNISPSEALQMEPQQRVLLEVVWEALERAGQMNDGLAGSQTGIFIGLMNSQQYAQRQIDAGNTACVDDPYYALGSSGSVAAGRLAYVLDVHGPCITIDTACSSSLVALHYACQSLRNQECNLAIVGGAYEITRAENVVNACKMGMLAADGRCKTFDAAADGFGMGEGCGVVVLKRLSDAQRDGDVIHALIRGSAVNQDGCSNGLTAPNKRAQQAVIQQALRNAGIAAQQVSYVETHGSGTALGDAIEVEALGATLCAGHEPDQPLMIGSVKSNIGHLAAAAGVAGLIKTILALQHQTIPPHLHLQQPSPNIAWDTLPIVVPTQPVAWQPDRAPRIAGISSFGWSGTNAHVVLEEAPPRPATPATQPAQLLVLSARTESALETATTNLRDYLEREPDLADVAYTLQVGRASHSYRRALVCHGRADALAALATPAAGRVLTSLHKSNQRSVQFMFPGVGDHYVNMGIDLYQSQPIFRDAVDHCCALLIPQIGIDLREIIYPDGTAAPAPETHPSVGPRQIDLRAMRRGSVGNAAPLQPIYRTALAQPALFVIEYALAQLWMAWGIHPQAMIGYSIGEYVAACLAGVFSLEDALQLVAQRAALIHQLPQGAMLAVAVSEQELQPWLGHNLWLSAVNGPMLCVVAGQADAITALEQELHKHGIACRRLQATHAFHSPMMEPIVDPFTSLVASIPLHAPRIPFVSNVTGTWITAEQATDPRYWARHLREAVRFADGVRELWQQPDVILLEVGPGNMLVSLALQHPASAQQTEQIVLQSMPHAHDPNPAIDIRLSTLGQLWLAGVSIRWSALYPGQQRQILPLPTYPFERQRFWVEPGRTRLAPSSRPQAKTPDLADWFYVPIWKQSPRLRGAARNDTLAQPCRWLVFADSCGIGAELAQRLQRQGQDVSIVVVGDAFRRLRDDVYSIDPRKQDDYAALLTHLHRIDKMPSRIAHMWSVTSDDAATLSETMLDQALELGFYSLIWLAQALGSRHLSGPIQLLVMTTNVHEVIGNDSRRPDKATVLGPCTTIPREHPDIICRSIDISLSPANSPARDALVEQLALEIDTESADLVVAYRGSHRWVKTYESIRLEDQGSNATQLRQRGVYLITGGLGGLGLALARSLAQTAQARLVLVGRSALPARDQWAAWIADHDAQDQTSARMRAVQALEAAGAEVLLATADVADLSQMQTVIASTKERFGAVNGVFHLAGVPSEGIIQRKEREAAAQVLAPKVHGTLILDTVLRDQPLDFMMLYSSTTSITGGFGEVDYSAANAFLDAFAHYQRVCRGVPTTAINWGPWQWDAWQSDRYRTMPQLDAHIKHVRANYGITFAEGEKVLYRLLGHQLPQVLVLTQDLPTMFDHVAAIGSLDSLEAEQHAQSAKPRFARPNLRNPYVPPRTPAEQQVAAIWQEYLGVEQVGVHDHFFELGGNSLIGMSIVGRLQKIFAVQLTVASLFEGPTISSLAALLQPQSGKQQTLQQNTSRGQARRERLKKR